MKILITGDLVINQTYSATNLGDQLKNLFKSSDYNIVNLEAPVTKSSSKILKTGPHLKAHQESTKEVLNALNIRLVTLANNHILDYDEQGVIDTLNFCNKNKLASVGAGRNNKEAAKIFYLNTPEGKFAIMNIAENEWASATSMKAGANGMNLIDDFRQLQEAKKNSDMVFVIVHGGHEYYNLPSPRMQKQYRFYAEQGADLVIGHHTHCVNGYETHNGVPIYYSLGNFLFTKPSIHKDWYEGLVLEIEVLNRNIKTKLHPVSQTKTDFKLDLLQGKNKEKILKRINIYNSIIAEESILNKEWRQYIAKRYSSYLNYWSPVAFIKNRYIRAILYRLKIRFIHKVGMAYSLNLMRCETHLDISKEVLMKFINIDKSKH